MFWRMDAARGGERRSSQSGLDPSAGGRAARCAAAGKDLDNDHATAAARARRAMIGHDLRIGGVACCRWLDLRHWGGHQLLGARDIGLAAGAGQQPVVADAMKPLWQNVEQKAPDELVGAERHCAVPRRPIAAVILVAEGHTALVESNETAVGDRHAMGVAGEIGKHCLWAGERRLGVDEPVFFVERRQMRSEGLTTTQALDLTKERQPTCRMGIGKCRQKEPPEQAGEHPHRQEEAGLQFTQRVASSDIPPPGTIIWTCGWWVIAEPQLWSTAVAPMRAPRCLGSAAIVISVSAAVRNSRS